MEKPVHYHRLPRHTMARAVALSISVAAGMAVLAPATVQAQATEDVSKSGKAMASQALPKTDMEFFDKAAIGGMTEVKAGELAQQKATDPAVKSFGDTLVQDHMKANTELQALATRKGVNLPTTLDADHQKTIDKLQKASGKEFDDEFTDAMNGAHKDAIALFEKTAKNSKDPDVKAFAAKTLPTLQSHAGVAKKLDAHH